MNRARLKINDFNEAITLKFDEDSDEAMILNSDETLLFMFFFRRRI